MFEMKITDILATARPIEKIHQVYWKCDYGNKRLKNIVTYNIADIKAQGFCYCHTDDEFNETLKAVKKLKKYKTYHEECVIIDGEKYRGMTKLCIEFN